MVSIRIVEFAFFRKALKLSIGVICRDPLCWHTDGTHGSAVKQSLRLVKAGREFPCGDADVFLDFIMRTLDFACIPSGSFHQAEMAIHYGTVVIPARVKKTKDQAKVAKAVQDAEHRILARLRNRTFFELEELKKATWEPGSGLRSAILYSRVLPGLQEAASEKLETLFFGQDGLVPALKVESKI